MSFAENARLFCALTITAAIAALFLFACMPDAAFAQGTGPLPAPVTAPASPPEAGAAPQANGPICRPRWEMAKILLDSFGEKSLFNATTAPDRFLEVFVSDRGTFTIVETDTSAMSCIVTGGANWSMQHLFGTPQGGRYS